MDKNVWTFQNLLKLYKFILMIYEPETVKCISYIYKAELYFAALFG